MVYLYLLTKRFWVHVIVHNPIIEQTYNTPPQITIIQHNHLDYIIL